MAGAVAGTPGTAPTNWNIGATTNLTLTVVGTGTENGVTYIDLRYTGTVTTARTQYIFPEQTNGIAASAGQTWTLSTWVKIVSGSIANISDITIRSDTRDSSFAYYNTVPGAISIKSSLSSTFTRFSSSGTTTGALVAYILPMIVLTTESSGLVDITLRIGMPQLEQGAFATSVISTSTAAATRSADVAIVNVNRWFYDTESTIYIETAIEGVGSSNYPWSIAVDNGTGSNRYGFYFVDAGADTYNKKMSTNGVGQIDEAGPVTLVANTFIKSAMAVKTNDLAAAYNGGNLQTDSSVNIPTNLTRLLIGSGDNTWSGWIKSVKYYPRRLSNAELITLTT